MRQDSFESSKADQIVSKADIPTLNSSSLDSEVDRKPSIEPAPAHRFVKQIDQGEPDLHPKTATSEEDSRLTGWLLVKGPSRDGHDKGDTVLYKRHKDRIILHLHNIGCSEYIYW